MFRRGFTLIEIVLVLAISGLLFIVIFMAVSGAQKSRRDTQRKNDLARIDGLVEQYASVHLGAYPKTSDIANPNSEFNQQYNTLGARDPKTNTVYPINPDFGPCDPTANIGNHGPGYVSFGTPGNNAPFRLRMCLENGGEFYIGN